MIALLLGFHFMVDVLLRNSNLDARNVGFVLLKRFSRISKQIQVNGLNS